MVMKDDEKIRDNTKDILGKSHPSDHVKQVS